MSDGPHNAPPAIARRKADHLALCASGEVEFRDKGTLLDEVQLVHDALPDRHFDEIDLTTTLLGKTLKAPVVISGMTGGTDEAAQLNRDLARAADRLGLGFGLGSQRAMVIAPDLTWTYRVRDVAPNALILGPLGIVQARQMSTETLARLHGELGIPIVLKETGAGLSRRVGLIARQIGITTVDTSAAGGTSWVGVETRRAEGGARKLGEELWDWGIPTAASVGLLGDLGLDIIATGGLRSGMDVARALALGARAGGLAAPVLRAHKEGGYDAVIAFLEHVIAGVRAAVFLTGCRTPAQLRSAPKVIGSTLKAWLEQAR
jgi:isopentenyl-diphosphate delta-isomerase